MQPGGFVFRGGYVHTLVRRPVVFLGGGQRYDYAVLVQHHTSQSAVPYLQYPLVPGLNETTVETRGRYPGLLEPHAPTSSIVN